MADSLTRYLSQLQALPSSDGLQKGVTAVNTVVDLSSFCLKTVSDRELAYSSSLLFHEETGIINFLRRTVLLDEFVDAKVELLKFLKSYIQKLDRRANPYSVEIKNICLKIFSQDHSSKVKVETFPLLVQLLEIKLESSVVEMLNVPKMIDKYFAACMQPSKQSSTVKYWLYYLLGTFAEVFPEHMITHSDRLVSMYLSILKTEMTSKTRKPDMPVIAGCLKGLTSSLTHFTQSVEEGSKYAKDIYSYARMSIDPQVSLARYDVPKAGLFLFTKHAAQFKEYLARDHEEVYDAFYRWCKHHNSEMNYAGYTAMEGFLKQMSEYFVSRGGNKADVGIFKAFIKKFRVIIDSNSSSTKETSIAIRGYGYFAKPCKLFMKAEDVKFMFSEMVQRSEQIYFRQEQLGDDKVQHLPSFLGALSCIVQELEEISDAFLASLERLVVVLFDNFPRLAKGSKALCCKAVARVLLNLISKGAALQSFLSEVVYQGLIRTCLHPVALEEGGEFGAAEEQVASGRSAPRVSFKDYIELWEFLLEKSRFKDVSLIGERLHQREIMHEMVYDEMIKAILRIIHKLDLSSIKEESTFGSEGELLLEATVSSTSDAPLSPAEKDPVSLSDPVAGLQPKVPKDFVVFINVVEFCKFVLPHHCITMFERWVYVFGRDIVVMSTRFPVVSGFYKLLEVCMSICKKIAFFKDIKGETSENTDENLDMEIVDTSDSMTCFVLFRKFIKEVLVKMQQYKDDLLASCLRLVLSLPHEMVVSDLPSIAPAVKLTFKLGLGYTPLAQAGLDALEAWTAALPHGILKPYLREILPFLDGYLKTSSESGEGAQSSDESKTIVLSSATRPGSRSRKIPLKLLKVKKEPQSQSTLAPLAKVRHQILRLLGSLGGQTNMFLLGDTTIDSTKTMAWDTESHLTFAVPFQDMKPTISLDPFLPRLVELATSSSDRQAKVAACESLHSLVLYMLGKSVTQPHGGEKSPMEKLWKRIFPALLQLACDVEQVAKQLFKPLVFQLIHWFTNNTKYESIETMTLLDAILDGIIHPTDTALRDFSAQCVREFLQWSIKQTSVKKLEKSPLNIKSLLKRLYSLALHPSASKRLGAALAFNNIYTIFREESSLVDIFVLEVLVYYLESLALAHNDERARGTQDQCVQVISHLERIIRARAQLLNKENSGRRIPRGFGSRNVITLSHVIPWLIKHCGKPQTECRHQCMRLVCQFAPLLPGVSSAAEWMKKTYDERPSFFVSRFEGGGGGQNGLKIYPSLSDFVGPFSLKETFLWFDFLLATLDCYTWSFSERLLTPGQIFAAAHSSVLLRSLTFFLSKLAMSGIAAACECYSPGGSVGKAEVFTPREIDDYNRAKCSVIVRIMNFVSVLLEGHSQETLQHITAEFWSHDLFNVLLSCVLEPGVVGFNMGDVEVIEKLPEQCGALCKTLSQKLPKPIMERLQNCLAKKIALGSHCNLFDQLPLPLCGRDELHLDHLRLGHLVQGYQQLHFSGLLFPALPLQVGETVQHVSSTLLSAVCVGVKSSSPNLSSPILNLTPASQQLASKLLELAFDLGLQHRVLMNAILPESTDASGSSFGLTFYKTFQTSVNGLFIREARLRISKILAKAAVYPHLISGMLNGILSQVIRDRTLRKRHASNVVAAILNCWSSLDVWWGEQQSVDMKQAVVTVLRKMLILEAKMVTDTSNPVCQSVFDVYLCLMNDRSSSLAFKSQLLELLPYFTKLPEEFLEKLKLALHRFVGDNFPLKSSEFIKGSPQYVDYIQALDKLLAAFVSSASLMLLHLLITIICRESQHAHEEQIQNSLMDFIRRLSVQTALGQTREAMDACFEIFLNERDYRPDSRRAVIERVCITFLLNTSAASLREFYLLHIKQIMIIIEAKQFKQTDPNLESQVTSKLCCYELVEILYSRLSKSELNTPDSSINKTYVSGDVKTGKELTMALTKAARAAIIEDMRGETVATELRRQYHCCAYNALAALISCTQTELKFYVGFLFAENPVKGQFLLDNLVDCSKTYEFEVELSAPIERKKQMTTIRMEARSRASDDDSQSGSPGNANSRSVHYMSSQFLADSSLSEDVSQFDFSTPIQAYSATDVTDSTRRTSLDNSIDEDSFEVSEETVEMDELNRHECMPKMTALLKHMLQNKISPEPQKGVSPTDMPTWMTCLHKKLTATGTHMNIRLFIAKLIINEPKIFEPYAKFWLSSLMEFVLEMKAKEEPGTTGINYFIVDLVVTVLSWCTSAIPEDTFGDRHLASRLLEFLMSRTEHRNRSVFRNNLEIIKSMVEIWKNRIQVPTKVIYDALSNPDSSKKDNAAGIQLLGIVVANGLSPIACYSPVDENKFYNGLVNNLVNKYKEVHAAAAEVTGMLMKYLADVQKVFDGEFHDMVTQKLISLVTSPRPEVDKFITCVHRLQINYPPIVGRFVNQILFKLPSVHGDFKTQCLEILCSRLEHIPNLFTELKTHGLKDMLAQRDEGSQIALLRILQGLLKTLRIEELQFIFPSVTAFITHPSILCRELMYDILIWIYDTYRADETFRAEEGAADILATAKDHLLRGLADDSRELKLKLRNFWSDETRLPGSTLERLVEILRAMYSPNTEIQYLSYTTNLILHLTSLSPDYNRLMFEQPLSECKFEEYQINYSWQQRHALMTPLFAATQGTVGYGMTQTQGSSSVDGPPGLRATQNLQFTPTQDQGKSQAFDWLNPSQEPSPYPSQSLAAGSFQAQSSLLFSTSHSRDRRKILKPIPRDFGSQKMIPSQSSVEASQVTSAQNEILRLKRRFLKDQSNRSSFFAQQEAKRRILREQAQEKQRVARESRVVMYRKYRTGDLPDIQIKYSELIAPLQAVAQCDSSLAKQLFSALFRGVFSQIEDTLPERQAAIVVTDIKMALNNMMSSSTHFFPPFISCVKDICYHESKLSLEPTAVSTACLTSLQQPIGIVLLEKQLLQIDDNGQKGSKRARSTVTPPSEATTSWIELSKLYRSLGDYDVLRGIFSEHIGTQPITRKALEAEARGDYSQALKLYNEAIECDTWSSVQPQQEEEDFWDDARLQCFANLTQWDNLEKFSILNVDDEDPPDLDKLWTDPFFQEHYLPYLTISKLKLQCQGRGDVSLNSFVTRALQNPERAALLQSRHSDSLALMYLLQDDYDRARYYAGSCEQCFLTDWAGLDSLMTASRSAKLQSLQKTVEMQEFLEFVSSEENFTSFSPVFTLLDKWSSRLPDPKLHSISVWDDFVTTRVVYMKKILKKFEASGGAGDRVSEITELKNKLIRHEVQLQLHIAETAKEQANFPVAVKYLKEALKRISQDDENLKITWSHIYAKVHHRKTQSMTAVEAMETALMTAGQLDKFSGSELLEIDSLRGFQHHILRSKTFDIMTKAISTDEGLVLSALESSKKENLASLCGLDNADSPKQVIHQLMRNSFKSLQSAIKAAKNAEEQNKELESSSGIVQAMMAMVNFCDSALRKKEEGEGPNIEVDMKLFPGIVVRYMLKAMCYGSDEARQKFPRLLQIVALYPETLDAFVNKAADVPCWMFIGWINQMMALLDKSEGRAVYAILQEIAQAYPQALWYPFKISSEQFVHDDSSEGKANREVVLRLQSILDNPLLNDFISALEQLTNPEMVFKDWCEGNMRQILENKEKRDNPQAIKECFQAMYKDLLEHRSQTEGASQVRGSEFGPFRERFAQEFSDEISELFGKEGENLVRLKPNAFNKMYRSLIGKMQKRPRASPPGTLKEYSPWFFNFQSSNHSHTLEIPGQYTGRAKPLPEYHVKIAGFDERVLVLSSIRKPKRITIRGGDEKDHMFLVKGGEDLRLDQRIEQLFELMNDVMAEDPACSQRGLRLRTYQVIPMTPRIGLIEWMNNTKPFKDVLQSAMTTVERQHYGARSGPSVVHDGWISKFKGDPSNPHSFYGEMYRKASRTETERNFRQRLGLVPWDLLRRAFTKMSASPEAFLNLRSHFASTHACLSICQYILGIGDRHLSNFMVDMETGGMIGIDFGHAFGSATQFLPVPELMPFRLTGQFVNLLLPLKESGILQSIMVHTLRALRNNHELLLNTMDVFIKEPSLDWQVFAHKQAKAEGINPDRDIAWYPRQKVQNARKKLEGYNPAHVTREDLYLGHKACRWYKQMEAVCLGDSSVNIRAREPDRGLSVESQVACLVDQAMDPNILGRTYSGWEPWM